MHSCNAKISLSAGRPCSPKLPICSQNLMPKMIEKKAFSVAHVLFIMSAKVDKSYTGFVSTSLDGSIYL